MIKIYFFLASLLALRMAIFFLTPAQKYQPGQVVVLGTTLDREPETVSGGQVFQVKNLIIYAPIVPELHSGDRVEVSGQVECSHRGQDCNKLGLYRSSLDILGHSKGNWWQEAAWTIRQEFVDVYESTLNRDQASLLSGIVLGNVGLDRSFKDRLANVGLTHVVAASGMNVSLFSGFVLWLGSGLRLGRGYKAIITAILILFYSTITGFEPPIVRAAIMALFSLLGVILGRQRSGLMGLLISAYLMLWVDPTLLTNASFLLSFFAMIGQIILSGFSIQLPKRNETITKILSFLTKDLVASLAAILATFPIVVIFFAKFSLISIFTNTLVLWTVEPLMILGGIAGIVGMVSLEMARLVVLPTGVLLSFFLWIVDLFGRDPRFLLRVSGLDWTFLFGYYLVLGAIIWWWRERQVGVYYKP